MKTDIRFKVMAIQNAAKDMQGKGLSVSFSDDAGLSIKTEDGLQLVELSAPQVVARYTYETGFDAVAAGLAEVEDGDYLDDEDDEEDE